MQSLPSTHARAALEQLRRGPCTARELASALDVSQPTVSRTLQRLDEQIVTIGAARSMQYALRDPARADLVADVYRVTPAGQVQELGTLVPVAPEGFVMIETTGTRVHSDGLPWWLYDMRPQGYLGRAYNQRHGARLGLPERLTDWGDSHALRALLLEGGDLPGNLLIGATAYAQFINSTPPTPIAPGEIREAYAALALAAARGDLQGSSAAGEQPKFTACIQAEDGTATQVIVKFSASVAGPVSARWRDLLLAEHLALEVLRDAGVAAARSRIIDHGVQRFLEVERFDRVGARGRRALHSLAALDAEFVGIGGRWPEIVRSLARRKVVAPEAVQGAELLWAFGTLIGNTDMHAGNLSFLSEQGRPYQLAPAYDMTPMVFAPTAGGDLPVRDLNLQVASQVPARAWVQALPLAREYVRRLRAQRTFSEEFSACVALLAGHVGLAQAKIGQIVE
ncbi:MAG: type II toxin-antitoxin system HipA family toxinoxin YjjJ [Hyphomicrobiales bacterium]|nr:MAG: type II toxin-antitoxin system HipA family toxinoxin YjjJ [Hyphomicrobiales bacterium]